MWLDAREEGAVVTWPRRMVQCNWEVGEQQVKLVAYPRNQIKSRQVNDLAAFCCLRIGGLKPLPANGDSLRLGFSFDRGSGSFYVKGKGLG